MSFLFSVDNQADRIVKHSGVLGSVISSFSSPSVSPAGLAITRQGSLVSSDISTDKIYVHNGATSIISSSFSSPAHHLDTAPFIKEPHALALTNTITQDLVSVDRQWGHVYVHFGISGTVAASFPSGAGGGYPVGATVNQDNNLVLSNHVGLGKIFVCSGLSSVVLSSFIGPASPSYPTGLAADHDNNLISADYQVSRIYYHSGMTATIQASVVPYFGGIVGLALLIDTESISPYIRAQCVLLGRDLSHVKCSAYLFSFGIVSHVKCGASVVEGNQGVDYTRCGAFLTTETVASIGDLITASSDSGDFGTFYVHLGIGNIVRQAIQAPPPPPGSSVKLGAVTISKQGDLVSSQGRTYGAIYVHDGVGPDIATSFPAPEFRATGLAVHRSGDLVSICTTKTVYVHSGISAVVKSSFVIPNIAPGDAGTPWDIAFDPGWRPIIVDPRFIRGGDPTNRVNAFQVFTNTLDNNPLGSLYRYFETGNPSGGIQTKAIDIVDQGNLISAHGSKIVVHQGVHSSELFSFDHPLFDNVDGLAIYSLRSIAPPEYFTYLSSSADVIIYELQGMSHLLASATIPGQVAWVSSGCTINLPVSDTEYYRDCRDFAGVYFAPSLTSTGKGYQAAYPPAPGFSWIFTLAPQRYAWTNLVTQTGGTSNPTYIETEFSDFYVNALGYPPPNRITGFESGNYHVWVFVLGGAGTEISQHVVKVGEAAEQAVSGPADVNVGIWRQVGSTTYAIGSSTRIKIRGIFYNDIRTRGIRAICLKTTSGQPSSTPTGMWGDSGSGNTKPSGAYEAKAENLVLVSSDTVYVHSGLSATIVQSFPLQYNTARGCTIDRSGGSGGDLYVIYDDLFGLPDPIHAHQGISSSVTRSFAGPFAGTPAGIAHSILDVFSVYHAPKKIYKQRVDTGAVISSFSIGSDVSPAGLAILNPAAGFPRLFVADNNNKYIYEYGGGSSYSGRYDTYGPWAFGGIASDGYSNLVSTELLADKVYIHSGVTAALKASFSMPPGLSIGRVDVWASSVRNPDYVGCSVRLWTYDAPDDLISSGLIGFNQPSAIYIHERVTGIISSSFQLVHLPPLAGDITLDGDRNLIYVDFRSEKIYLHSGITSTVTTSFNGPAPRTTGVAVDITTGRLISCGYSFDSGPPYTESNSTIFVHSGVSNIVVASFDTFILLKEDITGSVAGMLALASPYPDSCSIIMTTQWPKLGFDAFGNLCLAQYWGIVAPSGEVGQLILRFRGFSQYLQDVWFAPGAGDDNSSTGIASDSNGNLLVARDLDIQFRDSVFIVDNDTKSVITSFNLATDLAGGIVTTGLVARDFVAASCTFDVEELPWVSSGCFLTPIAYLSASCTTFIVPTEYIGSSCDLAVHIEFVSASCSVVFSAAEHVSSLCAVAAADVPPSFLTSSTDLIGQVLHYLRSSTSIASSATFGSLISADQTTDTIYVHLGSTIIQRTFASPDSVPSGLTIDLVGNLVLIGGSSTSMLYIFSGVTGTVTSSFAHPATNSRGAVVNSAGNLLSSSRDAAKIYLHAGISASVTSSFSTPEPSIMGIAVSPAGDIVGLSGSDGKIYVHLGISEAIKSSFTGTSTGIMDVAFDQYGHMIIIDEGVDRIVYHSGVSASVVTSFSTPGTRGSGIVVGGENGGAQRRLTQEAAVVEYELVGGAQRRLTQEAAVIEYELVGGAQRRLTQEAAVIEYELVGGAQRRLTQEAVIVEYTPAHIEYIRSGALVSTTQAFENLISSDLLDRVNTHAGMSAAVVSSFSRVQGNIRGITLDSAGNLIGVDIQSQAIYVHSGVSQDVTLSFSASTVGPSGVAVDKYNNAVLAGYSIAVMAGISGIISTIFNMSETAGGLAITYPAHDIVFTDRYSPILYVCSGISATIKDSFASPGALPADVAWSAYTQSLISSDYVAQKVYVHSGLSSAITLSFPTASKPIGITTDKPFQSTPTDFILSGVDVLISAEESITAGALVMTQSVDWLASGAELPPNEETAYLVSQNTLVLADNEERYLACYAALNVGADEYIDASANLRIEEYDRINSVAVVSVSMREFLASAAIATTVQRNYISASTAVNAENTAHVRAMTQVSVDGAAFTVGGCAVYLGAASYVGGHARVDIPVGGTLISCDLTSKLVYIHAGLSATILSSFSFAGASPNGLDVTAARDILVGDFSNGTIYIYSGLSSIVRETFALAGGGGTSGLATVGSNLVTANQNTKTLYVHSGVTNTVTASFAAPQTSGGGAAAVPTALGADSSDNLISAVASGHLWGNQTKVSVHSGASSVITTSFENTWGSYDLLLTGLASDIFDNIVSADIIAQRIRIHDGTKSAVYASFASPGFEPSGLGIAGTVTSFEDVLCTPAVQADVRVEVAASCEVLAPGVDHVIGICTLDPGGLLELLLAGTELLVVTQDSVLAGADLTFPGALDHLSVSATLSIESREFLQAGASLSIVSQVYYYCRDARDFRGMPGAYAVRTGYGYDAYSGGWSSSGGHGADYNSALHLTAADPPGASVQNTQFSDSYVNRENFAPANRIQNFAAGNYYVWLYVNGGTGNNAHAVTIGANPEVATASGSGVWQWKQVGTGTYYVDQATVIQFRHVADGYLHAIRHIVLKSSPGAPTEAPSGASGDCADISSFQQDHLQVSARVQASAREHLSSTTSVYAVNTEYVECRAVVPVLDQVRAAAYLNGEPFLDHLSSGTAVAFTAVESLRSACALDGEQQTEHLASAVALSVQNSAYIEARTDLDGQAFRSFVLSSTLIRQSGYDEVRGSADLATSPVNDTFDVLSPETILFLDFFDVTSYTSTVLFSDNFDVQEAAQNFTDVFRVRSVSDIYGNDDVIVVTLT